MKSVAIKLTNGFGNNLFQYIHCRLFSGDNCVAVKPPSKDYYALKDLRDVGLSFEVIKKCSNMDVMYGYYEDYEFYKPHISEIRPWFNPVEKTNTEDLVLHMRLTDRLLYKNSYQTGMYVSPETFSRAINEFDFRTLCIVTDMPCWKYITNEELDNMRFHVNIPDDIRTETKIGVKYMNSLVEELAQYKPCVNLNCGSIASHFDFIRKFDKIMFQHSTMAWWAAAISHASKVGVYGPWRPAKGKNNKNLGRTDYPGWFGWE